MPCVEQRPQNIFHLVDQRSGRQSAHATLRPKFLRRWPDVFTQRFARTLRTRRDGANLQSGKRAPGHQTTRRERQSLCLIAAKQGGRNSRPTFHFSGQLAAECSLGYGAAPHQANFRFWATVPCLRCLAYCSPISLNTLCVI